MSLSLIEKEISVRLKRFQNELKAHEVDSALVVQKMDLFYLSNTDQDAHLWVPSDGAPLLMVRKSLERARRDSPLERIVPIQGFSDLPRLVKREMHRLPKRLGLELDVIPAKFYLAYQRLFAESELVDISSIIRGVRMRKSPYEISLIEKASKVADQMYGLVPSFLQEAETETELALRIEAFYRSKGHPGLLRTRGFNLESYYGHVMAGKTAASTSNAPGPTGGEGMGPYFSHGAGPHKIRPRESIMVDHAAGVSGYVSDQTRIFSIGKLPEKFQDIDPAPPPMRCVIDLWNLIHR